MLNSKMIEVLQAPTFEKKVKKLHKNQKGDLDVAIRQIVTDPFLGEMKKSDLSGVRVYKFKMVGQLTLLAYTFYENELQLMLLSFGSHENFYRDLKK